MTKQTSLFAFIKTPKRRKVAAYCFLEDVPEFMISSNESAGPFRKGDLVSEGALPTRIWRVLLKRGVVKPYFIENL